MRNIEIKAKIPNVERICQIAEDISGASPTIIKQEDTFYKVAEGRLKMRFSEIVGEDNSATATLVRYDRGDEKGPKICDYDLLQFSASELDKARLLDNMLKKTIGMRGQVKKTRHLFMVGQTRIHIDTVEELGHFMELEVVLRPEQTVEEGQDIARVIQEKLGVSDDALIDCAYMDLLEDEKK